MNPVLRAMRIVVALVAMLAAAPAFPWGAEGHRIVGLVAEGLLDERARAELARLAGADSLADIGLWLDEDKRELRAEVHGSDRWHYDNRPVCHPEAPVATYCADGNCASRAFEKYRALLADHHAPPAERLFALRVVVHLVEDVHQPLHVADNGDRGGNEVMVRVGKRSRPKPLHAVWDADFVKRAVRGEPLPAFAAALVAEHRADARRLAAGGFADWMHESFALARNDAYGHLPGFACGGPPAGVVQLPPDYSDEGAQIVREQLARAGIRLAAVLEQSL